MFNVRVGCFETNSSSIHGISAFGSRFLLDLSLEANSAGVVILEGGEFGRGWEKFNDALTKANYLSLFLVDPSILKDIIIKQLKCKQVVIKGEGWIDHVNDHRMKNEFESEKDIADFIFNKNRWLYIGDDETNPPNKFYDPPNTKYLYRMEIRYEGEYRMWDFKKYPNNDDLKCALETIINNPYLKKGWEFNNFHIPADINKTSFSIVKDDCWAQAQMSFKPEELIPWDPTGYQKVLKKERELQKEGAIEIPYKISKWERPR